MTPQDEQQQQGTGRDIWRAVIPCPALIAEHEAIPYIFELFDDMTLCVFCHEAEQGGEENRIELLLDARPDETEIARRLKTLKQEKGLETGAIQCLVVEDTNWLLQVHENFPPVTIGRFFVYGSHYEGEVPDGLTGLHIDAATAFGSGEHETTQGCMEALQSLSRDFEFLNALDMGCGSGILAIALTKIWPDIDVTAIDIDPESIIVTERHAGFNDCADSIETEAGDGYAAPLVAKNGPYDLIVANILAGPLKEMAGDLAANLAPGGFCVLAGLLVRQREDVIAAHAIHGLKIWAELVHGEWQILVLRKGEDAPERDTGVSTI